MQLRELIDEVRSIVESLAEDRQHQLSVRIDPSATSARLDRSLVSRLLLNLADNAIRHTPHGGRIAIDAARAKDGALEVRVLNDGEPIPFAVRDKIFERYARLDAAIDAGVDTGRGLGLVFCRIAAEAHGGTIQVEESSEMRTCFVVRIPGG